MLQLFQVWMWTNMSTQPGTCYHCDKVLAVDTFGQPRIQKRATIVRAKRTKNGGPNLRVLVLEERAQGTGASLRNHPSREQSVRNQQISCLPVWIGTAATAVYTQDIFAMASSVPRRRASWDNGMQLPNHVGSYTGYRIHHERCNQVGAFWRSMYGFLLETCTSDEENNAICTSIHGKDADLLSKHT